MVRYNYSSLEDAIENGEGNERPFQCHVHGDTTASASVNMEKGVWYCFACTAKGRVDRKGKTFTTEMKAAIALLEESEKPITRPMSWLDIFDASGTHPYWEHRFGAAVAKRWRLGTHPLTGMPCYPVIGPDARVYGVVQRTQGKPKYIYPTGVPISRMLFGFTMRRASTVVVVEGACDAIAVSEALESMPATMVVGCYGAGLHLPQVHLINSISPDLVMLGFDSDDAGRRALGRSYPLDAAVTAIHWEHKDPGECSRESILAAVTRGEASAGGRPDKSGPGGPVVAGAAGPYV